MIVWHQHVKCIVRYDKLWIREIAVVVCIILRLYIYIYIYKRFCLQHINTCVSPDHQKLFWHLPLCPSRLWLLLSSWDIYSPAFFYFWVSRVLESSLIKRLTHSSSCWKPPAVFSHGIIRTLSRVFTIGSWQVRLQRMSTASHSDMRSPAPPKNVRRLSGSLLVWKQFM